jgi:L-asparaginase / beta-aspartyl-peptidase
MQIIRSSSTPGQAYSLAIHAGAGNRRRDFDAEQEAAAHAGLTRSLLAGKAVLEAGGSALDAVVAAVAVLEDEPSFNAGHGAALTDAGTAELDSAVMTGDLRSGAVAGSIHAKNPVKAARAVLEQSEHVFLIEPSVDQLAAWGLDVVEPDYFVTERRRAELEEHLADSAVGAKHGTVGAVARDAQGRLAAATSTGGKTGQRVGRVGDTPIIGAGTYANDDTVAISCTGDGERFIEGVVSYDISAQMEYLGTDAGDAIERTFARRLDAVGSTGGLVAVTAGGDVVLGFNSQAMFRGYLADGDVVASV